MQRLAAGQHGPRDVEPVVADGIRHAKMHIRVVSGHQDHLHAARIRRIQPEKRLNKVETGARREDILFVAALVIDERP